MNYQEYRPAPSLVPYIDCYWSLRMESQSAPLTRRVLPDICADIILNLGEEVQIWNREPYWIRSEKAYLIGTMTTCQDTWLQPGANLIGIRFKPFGLGALLGIRLQGVADKIEELSRNTFSMDYGLCQSLGIDQGHKVALNKLNTWLLHQIDGKDNTLVNRLIGTVLEVHGQISVGKLAGQYHLTERQLERKFKEMVGVSLKEICNLTRFQYTYQLILSRKERSLLDVAFEAGYFDHAHLTRHFKRYAGCLPSQIG